MYTYKQTEPGLWTVGYYEGVKWQPESDHTSVTEAANRVHFLNGGVDQDAIADKINKAIEVAYQNGFNAGQGLKG